MAVGAPSVAAPPRRVPRWTLALCLTLSGCDVPPELASAEGPRVLASEPSEGETGVDRAASLRVWLDRRVMPGDVHRGRVSLQSGTRGAYLSPRFDPVDRVLTIELLGGPLDPDVLYRLRLDGLRDLDLALMSQPWEITFWTGTEAQGDAPMDRVGFEDVAPIFAGCAAAGCHAPPAPALGLDLSSAEAIRATAIGAVARQSQIGVQSDDPWRGASTLDGLARIDVVAGLGRPSRSYLLYKVLEDPHARGERMPPEPAAPLTPSELSLLSRWISGGAPTD